MILQVNCHEQKYDVVVQKGIIENLSSYMNVHQQILCITDDGVPQQWVDIVTKQLTNCTVCVVKQGEQSKSFSTLQHCLTVMLENNFTRKSCVVALGGGVVGDLSGLVAALYNRGVDFINIPTTTLSQIDSSIGGKVAINLEGAKNSVGVFYQPKKVLIDTTVLSTLSHRQISSGLVEALKAGLIYDKSLFDLFLQETLDIDTIIIKALDVKRKVVEIDEKELGLRKILNFGHTIGHGIESVTGCKQYTHGECVGMGMVMMIDNEVLKNQVIDILHKLNCPLDIDVDAEEVMKFINKDKKKNEHSITVVIVYECGEATLVDCTLDQLKERLVHYLEK